MLVSAQSLDMIIMKLFVVILAIASLAYADIPNNTAYGYIKNYGIPLAEKLKAQEASRIIGGVPAVVGQYPSFAGLLGDVVGTNAVAVCGSSLISPSRLVTAAHCWNDGQNQIWRYTIVFGHTQNLFAEGGIRYQSSVVIQHPNWSPVLARNDVAIIFLPSAVTHYDLIQPIALPSGPLLSENFQGQNAIAVGFGVTIEGNIGTLAQGLNHVNLNVISNTICSVAFPLVVNSDNICTSGLGGANICSGDSGGPLLINQNNQQVLIGISSFVSGLGCSSNLPGVYARVTSFVDFINQYKD